MATQQVILVVEVAAGNYCWEYSASRVACPHFSNEGGTPWCNMGLGRVDDTYKGVVKSKQCSDLALHK